MGGQGDDFVFSPLQYFGDESLDMEKEPGMEVGTWKGARPMLNFKGIVSACARWVTRPLC